MAKKRMMTLDDLYKFFVQQNKSFNFNSKESGEPIVVTTNGFFESQETDMPGMLGLQLKVCHTELNRNGSFISKENMSRKFSREWIVSFITFSLCIRISCTIVFIFNT